MNLGRQANDFSKNYPTHRYKFVQLISDFSKNFLNFGCIPQTKIDTYASAAEKPFLFQLMLNGCIMVF